MRKDVTAWLLGEHKRELEDSVRRRSVDIEGQRDLVSGAAEPMRGPRRYDHQIALSEPCLFAANFRLHGSLENEEDLITCPMSIEGFAADSARIQPHDRGLCPVGSNQNIKPARPIPNVGLFHRA